LAIGDICATTLVAHTPVQTVWSGLGIAGETFDSCVLHFLVHVADLPSCIHAAPRRQKI
jgi:hypothetical protein